MYASVGSPARTGLGLNREKTSRLRSRSLSNARHLPALSLTGFSRTNPHTFSGTNGPHLPGPRPLRQDKEYALGTQNLIIANAGATGSGDDIQKEALGLRRISWISFWLQLALSIVSAIVLFFTASTASRGAFPQAPVFFNLGGVILGFISTFLSYSRTRVARGVIEANKKVSSSKVAADVLGATRLNLFGLGLTLVGLQSTVGGLVGKALTSSSAGAYNVQSAQNAPAALDVFAVQASTNTILLHFLAIVFANWTLRILNRDTKAAAPA